MGSRNYTHKLKWRAGDAGPGISEQGAEGWGGKKGRRAKKEKLSVGGFLLPPPTPPHFSSWVSLVWVCIMWWCVIGLWSHWSCTNRLAGKHVSSPVCGGECVCCPDYRCGIVEQKVWRSKTCINGEQVGPVDFVIDKFVLVGTRGKSGAYSKPLCAVERQYSTQVYSSMDTVSMPHLSSINPIMFS